MPAACKFRLQLLIYAHLIKAKLQWSITQTRSRRLAFTDGSFHQLSTLTVDRLEFVSRSRLELETMLKQYILSERYEKCALIRDELLKR
jgi:hypothetical protein